MMLNYAPALIALIVCIVAIAHEHTDTIDIAFALVGVFLSLLWLRLGPFDVVWGEVWTLPAGGVAVVYGLWRSGVLGWLIAVPSSYTPVTSAATLFDTAAQTEPLDAQSVIDMPQNEHNRPFVFGPEIVRLAQLTGDTPAEIDRAICVLGRLCTTKARSGRPLLGVTDAIKHGLKISPGTRSPRYEAAKDALEREIGRLTQPDGPQFVQPDGSMGPATYPVTERIGQ